MRWKLTALLLVYIVASSLTVKISCVPVKESREHRGGVYHIVRPHQTLYRIALTYKVPLETIARANNLADISRIRNGQRLFIPGARRVLDVPIYKGPVVHLTKLPTAGRITSRFGQRRGNGWHTGVDIAAPRGSSITAVLPGTVIFAGRSGRYGNVIRIRHDNDLESLYAHNLKHYVKKGSKVRKGQKIATVGKTGRATGYHVHFELLYKGEHIDPLVYLAKN